jgi:pimeloyl-ACP methyl ester carboxylesterase
MRFVLVHGAFHGKWCWSRVIPELEQLGYEAIAIDLPGHGERRSEVATLDGYRDAVLEVLMPNDVLVGHSQGGTVITTVADAAQVPLAHLIYLASPIPAEGTSLGEETAKGPIAMNMPGIEFSESEFWFKDSESTAFFFYGDCSPEDQQWAFGQIHPQAIAPVMTPIHLKNFWTSSTPRSFIACLNDQSQALFSTETTVRRLKIRAARTMWASHSPFISRPRDLAELFVDIVVHPVGSTPDPDL